jgi:hypothetical protein
VATGEHFEAEPSLLWERVVVAILSTLPITVLLVPFSTDIRALWLGYVVAGSAALAWVVFPAVFGFRLGHKLRSLRFWRNVAPGAALLAFVSLIAGGLLVGGAAVFLAGIPSIVYIFAAVLGNALRRRRTREKLIEERPSDFRPEAVSGTQGWTPRQQAIVGLVGTIISALIGLIGTILTVLASGSGL